MFHSFLKEDGNTTLETLSSSTVLANLSREIDEKKRNLIAQSRTAELWIKYLQMIGTARALIKADRTGSWSNHLKAVEECLPILAVAGHYNYLKTSHHYLQQMSQLETKHPDVYQKFQEGLHVIRRTDRQWSGLACDLVMEQTLMRSIKSSGGLTHGSKMTEEQRALWVMSTPITSQYSNAMQEFTGVIHATSEQHKEVGDSRVVRDKSDMETIRAKLESCSPFSTDPSLRNIVTGIVAGEDVDVHKYEKVGKGVMDRMLVQPVFLH